MYKVAYVHGDAQSRSREGLPALTCKSLPMALIELFVEDDVSPSLVGKGRCRILDSQHQRICIRKYLMLGPARDLEPRSFAVFQKCIVNQNFARTRDEAQGCIVGFVMVSNVPVVRASCK